MEEDEEEFSEPGRASSVVVERRVTVMEEKVNQDMRIELESKSDGPESDGRWLKVGKKERKASLALGVALIEPVLVSTGTLHADGDKLFCTTCNLTLDATRKGSINWHLEPEAHVERKAVTEADHQKKKQATMSSLFKKTTDSRLASKKAEFSLTEAFAAANILLEKLDHPELGDYLKNKCQMLAVFRELTKLHQDYLPAVIFSHAKFMKIVLSEDESFSVLADKATDPQDNYLLHVLYVLGSWTDRDLPVLQTEPILLTSVNFPTLCQAIVKIFCNYGIEFNQVSAFLSKSATYMCKAFTDVHQGMLPNTSCHLQCIHSFPRKPVEMGAVPGSNCKTKPILQAFHSWIWEDSPLDCLHTVSLPVSACLAPGTQGQYQNIACHTQHIVQQMKCISGFSTGLYWKKDLGFTVGTSALLHGQQQCKSKKNE
ncbi:hypothetical protein Y1Q_0022632 [Alligator mississippiensis]|uniref:Uncharacterized protein n=1 Tax=Alligator mississippiensis TaxID=8496 RepID=A0A151PH22_ALLMI|nr:hypothetical protein Y1Q_0022632 [Alligator mississippiensis]